MPCAVGPAAAAGDWAKVNKLLSPTVRLEPPASSPGAHEHERAAGDRRAAVKAAAAAEDQLPVAFFEKSAVAADGARIRQGIGVVEGQGCPHVHGDGQLLARPSPLPPLPICNVPASMVVAPV